MSYWDMDPVLREFVRQRAQSLIKQEQDEVALTGSSILRCPDGCLFVFYEEVLSPPICSVDFGEGDRAVYGWFMDGEYRTVSIVPPPDENLLVVLDERDDNCANF